MSTCRKWDAKEEKTFGTLDISMAIYVIHRVPPHSNVYGTVMLLACVGLPDCVTIHIHIALLPLRTLGGSAVVFYRQAVQIKPNQHGLLHLVVLFPISHES